MTVAGLLATAGYAVAAWKLAALSWDGSWYLFRSLQDQAPFTPHERYGTYPVLWLVVQASKIISDPGWLGMFYGWLLALFPLGSLALSWHYLRGERLEPLRIWPTLGILLTPLPGQLCLMSEATLAAQLMWPLLAILVAGRRGRWSRVWLTLLAVCLGFLHPTAVPIFALAALVSGWQAWRQPGRDREARAWAVLFGGLAVGEFGLASFTVSAYERSQMSRAEVWQQAQNSVPGFPLMLLLLVYALGFLTVVAAAGKNRRWLTSDFSRWLGAVLCAAMIVGGVRWAAEAAAWRGGLDYRRFVLPAALPLVGLAYWHYQRLARPADAPPRLRGGALTPIAAVFCLILVTNALAWRSLLERLARELDRGPWAPRFVLADELPFTRQTNLRHWAACPLSILLQGRRPGAIFVLRAQDVQAHSVRVDPWEEIALTDGWFSLAPFNRP